MSDAALPAGFEVGHWSDPDARTGCTVVLAPPGTRGGVDVRGGGPGTRETDILSPLANADIVSAVVLSGGSAYGLAAAAGVVRWLEERGRGYETPGGIVPIVPAAVVYDLNEGDGTVRPGPDEGYAACEAAVPGTPDRGRVGAGSGTAAAKGLGRPAATAAGVGFAAERLASGITVAAVAVVNPTGDVFDADGSVLAAPRSPDGAEVRTGELLRSVTEPPDFTGERENTTLVVICTDAGLGKLGCAKVARMASAGIARAVDPVFTPFDGDVSFCLASGAGEPDSWGIAALGTAAASLAADAIRDGVRAAA